MTYEEKRAHLFFNLSENSRLISNPASLNPHLLFTVRQAHPILYHSIKPQIRIFDVRAVQAETFGAFTLGIDTGTGLIRDSGPGYDPDRDYVFRNFQHLISNLRYPQGAG